MAGLLDSLMGSSIDDPKTLGLLQLAASLSSGPKFMPALSEGLLGRSQIMSSAERQKAQQQMQQMQLQQAQRQMAQQQAQDQFRASIPSPQMQASQAALAGGGGPTMANAQNMRQVDPMAQMMHGAMQAGVVDPMQYLASLQPKPRKLTTVAPGASVIDENDPSKPLFTAPKEVSKPAALQEYEFAKSQGYGGSFLDFQLAQKRAGATAVNVNTAKPLMNTIAEGLGKQIDASLETAKAAQSSIQTAQNLKAAVDSGKIIAGPGASFRVAGLQLGQMLGVSGKDAAETLANTRTAIQSMAQAELNAAAQMKGQGQITEAERALLKRAASGDIDSLTAPEIRLLADVSERTARSKIGAHKSNLERLKAMPEAAPLIPFYGVEAPPEYTAPTGAAKVRRYNPATGKIE